MHRRLDNTNENGFLKPQRWKSARRRPDKIFTRIGRSTVFFFFFFNTEIASCYVYKKKKYSVEGVRGNCEKLLNRHNIPEKQDLIGGCLQWLSGQKKKRQNFRGIRIERSESFKPSFKSVSNSLQINREYRAQFPSFSRVNSKFKVDLNFRSNKRRRMLETGAVRTDNESTETVSFIRVRVSHSVKLTVWTMFNEPR